MRRSVPSESLTRQPVAVDVGHHGAELNLDPHLLQPFLGPFAQLLAHRRQHRRCGVEQDHPGLGGVDVPEATAQRLICQFGDLPGHFDTGRTGAHHGEGQQLGAAHRIAGTLGLFERAEDTATEFQRVVDRLHAGSELGEMIVAEVGLPGAGRDDQAVVRRGIGVPEQHRIHRLVLQIDVGDVAQQHLGVLLLTQDHAGGRRDLAFGDDAGGHLVQQRLEQVVGGAGDQLDVDVGTFQGLRRRSDRRNPIR